MTTPLEDRLAPRHMHDATLVRAHARWILLVTLVAVLSACLLPLLVQGPRYRSEAEILVGASPLSAVPPTMETEVKVVASAAVLTPVVEETGTSLERLRRNLSVTVPPESTVLQVRYSDAGPARAQRRAQAVADAYVGYRGAAATVLSPATRPTSPSSPDYLLNAGAGFVLGLLIGVGSALLRDRLDDRVRGPRDVEQHTGLPVLATVPAADATDAATAEAYRIARTKVERVGNSLDYHGRHLEVLSTAGVLLVAVTGAGSDDGAERTAQGLAVAMARAGARVVLVDADLRAAKVTDRGDAGQGLADVLRKHADLAEALQDGPVAGLRLLGPGSSPEGVEDLLAGRRLVEVLQRLRAGGDHVVVHVAPVLGAAETLVIAALADQVVLSAIVGATTRQQLTVAVSELRGAGGHSLACVVHDSPRPERVPAGARSQDQPGAGRAERPQSSTEHAESLGRPIPEGGRAAARVVGRR